MRISKVIAGIAPFIFVLGFPSSPTTAKGFKVVNISGTHGQREIAGKCAAAGGTFSAGSDGTYGCGTNCKGGQGSDCTVQCNSKGACTGTVPGRVLRKGLGVAGALTLPVAGQESPQPPGSRPATGVMSGGGILDSGPGLSWQGPAASTGAPLSTGRGSAPSGQIK